MNVLIVSKVTISLLVCLLIYECTNCKQSDNFLACLLLIYKCTNCKQSGCTNIQNHSVLNPVTQSDSTVIYSISQSLFFSYHLLCESEYIIYLDLDK
jgi:hypothetical protein